MVIGIDASRAVNEEAGIGRYTREVVKRLIDLAADDQFRLFFTFVRDDGHKKRWIADLVSHKENVSVKILPIPGQVKEWLWGQSWMSIGRFMPGAEIIFSPSFFEAAVGEKTPQVVMIHDLSHAIFPDQRGRGVSKRLTERNKAIAEVAARLIAPSEATEDDLVQLFGVGKEKVAVIPEAYNPYFTEQTGLERQPFFLFLGTISPRKNLIGMMEAYAKLPDDIRTGYKLKIAGAEGWNTGETYQAYERLQLGDRVEFLGKVSDEVLRTLYTQSAAFLFPSFYEGFGIPILEAMACGCPVITSSISSMPEVAGEAALLVDPKDHHALARAMERLVTDPHLWAKLRRAGLERAKEFTWERTAKETLEVIHAIGRQT